MPEVTKVTVVEPYVIEVVFNDGVCRRIDLSGELWGEVFEPLKDPELFGQAFVDPVSRTVAWPMGQTWRQNGCTNLIPKSTGR